jgi:hypothetical protein
LYQGTASAVPKSVIFTRALAPEQQVRELKAHILLRPFGTTKQAAEKVRKQIPRGLKPARDDKNRRPDGTTKVVP